MDEDVPIRIAAPAAINHTHLVAKKRCAAVNGLRPLYRWMRIEQLFMRSICAYSGRTFHDYLVGWHIFGHYRPRCDHRLLTYLHSRKQNRPHSDSSPLSDQRTTNALETI